MKLTRIEEVAILMVAQLAEIPGRQVSLSEIGEKHGIPLPFLKKIARMLKTAGIVKSREGASGGYVLADRQDMTVGSVISAVTPQMVPRVGKSVSEICPLRPSCLPQTVRLKVGEAIVGALESVRISGLSGERPKKYE